MQVFLFFFCTPITQPFNHFTVTEDFWLHFTDRSILNKAGHTELIYQYRVFKNIRWHNITDNLAVYYLL